MFGKIKTLANSSRFVYTNAKDALDKVHKIGSKKVKFEMKSFNYIYKKKPEYLIIKEKGLWYFRLC
jgi:hypothetical protein